MRLIDTHCHLYLEEFDTDRELMIGKARESGIEALLLPNVDTETVGRLYDLCDKYPHFTYPMMGLHPTSVNGDYVSRLKQIEKHLSDRLFIAIGEIGIDLYWDKTWIKEQKIVFEEQLRWSIDKRLPVVIHTREAFPEVFDSLYKVGVEKLTGVFHSFSGKEEELEEIKKLPGFMIGINGVVTFKNSGLADVIRLADPGKILLETDAPYLAPVPYRGKRNEPVYIWETAKKVAAIWETSLETVVSTTTENAKKLFWNMNHAI